MHERKKHAGRWIALLAVACLLAGTAAPGTLAAEQRRTLSYGSKGAQVKELQQFLKNRDYYSGPISGSMGTQTVRALKEYQKDAGLTPDGIAGVKTWNAVLGRSDSSSAPYGTDAGTVAALGTATLRYGVRSKAVQALQTRLKTLGYFSGSATGYFGTTTRAAVKAFQRANGLTADGIVGSATRARLNGETANRPATGTGIPDGAALGNKTLKKGSTGNAVLALQQRLKAMGYYDGALNGTFGAQTRKAVIRFQQANGLTADGIVGSATRARLSGEGANPQATTIPTQGIAGNAQPDILNGNETLQKGQESESVRSLQRKLTALGYYSGAISGHYGTKTKQAVIDFQRANGLSADGIVGKATRDKLNGITLSTPTPAPTPTPNVTPTPAPTAAQEETPAPTPTPNPTPAQEETPAPLPASPGEAAA